MVRSVSMVAAPPRTVGKYRLYEKIGSGGMGSVHLGRLFAPGGFRRIVAIKRLHPQFAEDASFVSAFLDEARLASRVHHPNVVAPLDVVATDGEVFLVFEHLLGVSLAVLVRRAMERGESIPPPVAVSIMVDVLHGLHAAHEATGDDGESLHLVHRDVSPQNIVVGKDGSTRLLDFGIAKAAGRAQTTGEGIVKGKRGYMAPEHLLGRTCRASDIYSASVVLWEMLAERRLFADEPSIADRLDGRAIESPFVTARATWSNPETIESILLRGLAHAPEHRFTTAREMAIALETLGLATSREVGEWVERTGHAELLERARLVSVVESSVVEASSGELPSSLDSSAHSAGAPAGIALSVTSHDPPPSHSSGTRQRRGALVAAAVIALISCLGLAALLGLRRAPLPAGTTGPEAAPALAKLATSEPLPVLAEAAPAPALAPSIAEGAATSDAKPASTAPKPPTSTRPRPQAKRPGGHCAPYVIDSHGRKQFNEECLR
jgi:serine/threonine-protein kinase